MPFPWKKNRVPRISQFVADLQSPKRGGSLVVETGFPTSLIDLFVKNRSRFRKQRSKKPPPPDIPDPRPPPPPPPPSPATSPPPPRVHTVPIPQIEQNDNPVLAPDRITDCPNASGVNACILVVKILMVLVLVASVKRLTVGITVSAFALLLLEYAGRRVVSCHVVAESWFQKVLKKEHVRGGGIEFAKLTQLSYEGLSIDEIEVVETTSGCEIGDVESELIEDCSSKVLEQCLCDDDVSECKIRTSRSGRFRSKMVKKLASMKFRGSKKEKKNKPNEGESGSEISSAVGEEKLPILEIEEEEEEEEENEDKSSNTKLDCGITCSYNEKRVERVGNSGSSMVLVMIALVGLLLGRFPALALLMTWCCLMKIGRTLWRSQNVPLIKCSVSNS